ncbi:MAG: 4'-phosphopantetheinyl transferase superfamily protein [candidate division NC10 bacterium]|nr:4'-phosphopantetheinyl transferase superfamily protein [candidate division NC10 bacterium]
MERARVEGHRKKSSSNCSCRGNVAALASCHVSWDAPPEVLALGSDEVHVWRAGLNQKASLVQGLLMILSADEKVRAERFSFQRDREHFIVARGMLRAILGRYLQREPTNIRFCYSPKGKPVLAQGLGGDALRFNLSHSHGLALCAVTNGREIGIDLEQVRPDLKVEEIARRFFSSDEVATLRTLPPQMQSEAFFACWTRKEAYIKAKGEGLSFPLHEFDVSLAPGEPAALLTTREGPQESSRWTLQELMPGPGYAAALAVEGNGWRLARWEWSAERIMYGVTEHLNTNWQEHPLRQIQQNS